LGLGFLEVKENINGVLLLTTSNGNQISHVSFFVFLV
jgi:hypothetical protein